MKYIEFSVNLLLIFPVVTFFIISLLPKSYEKTIGLVSFVSLWFATIIIILLLLELIFNKVYFLDIPELILYKETGFEFLIDIFIDWISIIFLLLGSIITLIIVYFSKTYLKGEEGFKRYFLIITIFYFSYNLSVIAGNLETILIGWEALGLSSFLLIAFYRERFIPARNALKVFSIYRIGDVGLVLSIWATHNLFHESKKFYDLIAMGNIPKLDSYSYWLLLFISLCLLMTASAKSAAFPFMAWLPRAMEGPTPSSAIFYGSLSIHMGIYLLLRTYNIWSQIQEFKYILGTIGILTSIIGYQLYRFQYSVKIKIGYISLANIGLIFIELAIGWIQLAIIHTILNAIIRTYQLLISPSSIAYMIRDQFFHFQSKKIQTITSDLMKKIHYTLFHLSVKEFYLDILFDRYIFGIFRKIGKIFNFLKPFHIFILSIIIISFGFLILNFNVYSKDIIKLIYTSILSVLNFIFISRAFGERNHPRMVWYLNIFNHIYLILAIMVYETISKMNIFLYVTGVTVNGVVGLLILNKIKKEYTQDFNLNDYHGFIYIYRWESLVFLISALGLIGFPISSTFLGEDLILSHIEPDQGFLAISFTISYILSGISIIRLYCKLFFGPFKGGENGTTIHAA